MIKTAQTTFEKGGEHALRLLLIEQLEARFGALPEAVRERVSALRAEQLRELGRGLMRANSLADLGLGDGG